MKNHNYRILLPVFSLLLVFLFVGGTLSPVKQTARFPLLTEAQLNIQRIFGLDDPPKRTETTEMIYVQGGTFQMGSNSGQADEQPVHPVTLSSFYIGKYEVTQAEWVEVMGSNPSYFQDASKPVEQVNWYDAVAFCNQKSINEGFTPVYSGSGENITANWDANGYRLPTEAEWEYAARGGNMSNGYTYSGSNNVDEVAWYGSNGSSQTHPVGTKLPNELGIYDMSGNVWEWCWDWYGAYIAGSQSNPTGPTNGTVRALRGLCWNNWAEVMYITQRQESIDENTRDYGLGFRIVRHHNPSTVSSDTLYSLPGDTILVPINIRSFNNVGAISLKINYDRTVMTFVEGVNWSPLVPGALANTRNGVLSIGWEDITGFSTDSTKLVDLKFVYIGDSTAFAFNTSICEITDIDEQPIIVTYTNGAVYPDLGTPLTGTLAYRNTAFTPLNNVIVRLLKNSTKVDSSAANTSGVFGWTNIVQGNYTLQTVPPSAWGGVNSTDALALRRFIAGLRSLDTLQILAGDVNNTGTLSSADALLIRRRFVHLDNTFARGNWVFETPSLRKYHRSQTQDILGICVGDVNASFIPGLAKQTPSIQYFPQGEIALQNGAAIKYPVYARSESNLGAVTLVFDFDPAAVSIAGIESKMEGLMYNVQNGQLIIAWDDLAGIEANEQSPLLTILLTGKEGSEKGNVRFVLNEAASELADINANVLQGAVITSPSFSPVVPNEFALEQNFPNPFNPTTTIQYDIPTNAHVRVEIFNTLGEVVDVLADAVQAPGRYSVEWNAKNFTTGVYFYRITAESGTKNFMQVKKLMLIK